MDYFDLPTMGFRKDRWVSVKHPETFVWEGEEYQTPMIVKEHWTSCHPENNGVYLEEVVYIG